MSKERNSKSRSRRRVLSICISFFISLCTTLILTAILLKGGLFNQQMFKQTLSESTFYDTKLVDVKANINDILVSAGFPEEISEEAITRTLITMEVSKVMRGDEVDTTEFSNVMKEKMMEYLTENDIPVTGAMTQAIDRMVVEMSKVYSTHMTFLFVKMYNEFCAKYMTLINYVMYISLAVLAVCMVAVMMMYTRKYRAIRYIGYGILAGSLVTEVIAIVSKRSVIGMLAGKSTEYYKVIITFVGKSFSQGIYMCLGGIMLFCLIVLMSSYMKKQVI